MCRTPDLGRIPLTMQLGLVACLLLSAQVKQISCHVTTLTSEGRRHVSPDVARTPMERTHNSVFYDRHLTRVTTTLTANSVNQSRPEGSAGTLSTSRHAITNLSNTTFRSENASVTTEDVIITENEKSSSGLNYCIKVSAAVAVVYSIISMGGLAGNAISIAVLSRMTSNMATSLLLSVLAVWDSVFLLCVIFIMALPTVSAVYFPIPNSNGPFAYMLMHGATIFTIANLASTWTIVLLTCHRYIAICRPHHAARLCRPSVAKWQLFTIHIATIAFTMPLFFDSKMIVVKVGDTTNYLWSFSGFGADHVYQILYRSVLYLVLAYATPLTSLGVLAVLLIRAVRQANKRRAEMTSGKCVAREDVTKILIAVVLVFVVCQIWNPILRIIAATTLRRAGCGNAYYAILLIATMMSTINSSANFLIYIWFGASFRQTMKSMLCKCIKTPTQPTFDPEGKSDDKTVTTKPTCAHDNEEKVQKPSTSI